MSLEYISTMNCSQNGIEVKKATAVFFVQFPIAQIDLLGAAESLGSQLALYPERQEFHSTLDEDYDDTEGKV